jgi:hypothetical protein
LTSSYYLSVVFFSSLSAAKIGGADRASKHINPTNRNRRLRRDRGIGRPPEGDWRAPTSWIISLSGSGVKKETWSRQKRAISRRVQLLSRRTKKAPAIQSAGGGRNGSPGPSMGFPRPQRRFHALLPPSDLSCPVHQERSPGGEPLQPRGEIPQDRSHRESP